MPLPSKPPTLTISLVAVPEISAAVLYGLHEVFSAVGETWQLITGKPTDTPKISVKIVAKSKEKLNTNLGIPVIPDSSFDDKNNSNIIVVADLNLEPGIDFRGQWPEVSQWLQKQYQQGAVICSVCTGAIMLAETGLLNNQEATTHWSSQQLFKMYYPKITLTPKRVLLPTGPEHRMITSGGSASWSDLALYLIARFYGQEEARRIAKIFLFGFH